MNNSGPKIDPCGTPAVLDVSSDIFPVSLKKFKSPTLEMCNFSFTGICFSYPFPGLISYVPVLICSGFLPFSFYLMYVLLCLGYLSSICLNYSNFPFRICFDSSHVLFNRYSFPCLLFGYDVICPATNQLPRSCD